MFIFIFFLQCVMSAHALVPPDVSTPIKGVAKNKTDAAIVIGNEPYIQFPQVIYASKDAELMTSVFRDTLNIYKSRVFSINNADQKKIKKTLKRSIKKVRKGTLWVYYSGHGYVRKSGERGILPSDAKYNALSESSISFNEIFATAKKNKRIKRVVIIADANFGRKGRDDLEVYAREKIGTATPLPDANFSEIVWIPSEDQSPAPFFPIVQHGLFTYLVAGSWRGWADGEIDGRRDGTLTFGEMQNYVRHKMVALGIPITPTLFSAPEVQEVVIHSLPQEEPPSAKALHDLATDFFSRRIESAADYLKAQANNDWQMTIFEAQKGGQDGEDALRSFLQKYEYSTISMKWAIYVPQVQEARQLMQTYEREGNIGSFSVEDCQDREEMQAIAFKGALSDGQAGCIKSQIRLNRTQTERTKLSLILITNAQVGKDMKRWEKLVRLHLEQYDRSNPTLCLGFSSFLYQKGEDSFREALKWANYANETRSNWQGGEDFKHKSNTLLKLRTELATNLWIQAEEVYRQERSPEHEEEVMVMRGLAKECAREWLDYARAADLLEDARKAFDMCVSAGGVDSCKD